MEQPAKTTVEFIEEAERVVGDAFKAELRDHLALAKRVVDMAGALIEHVQYAPGEMRAIHAGAVLLARLVTDLHAISLLLRNGYAAEALSLTAGMLEMCHTAMYMGANEERAEKWLSHADPKRGSPWTLKEMLAGLAVELHVGEETIRREYDKIYRDANMAKHGNPMALGDVGLVQGEDAVYVLAGPHLSEPTRRWARTAISHAIRYSKLAALKFLQDHLPDSPWRREALAEFNSMSIEFARIQQLDVAEFDGHEQSEQ